MFSSRPSDPSPAATGSGSPVGGASTPGSGLPSEAAEPDTASLIAQLDQDRLWLLRQIDSGRWSDWRLDLAALERELGQLLDQVRERGDL